jgi:hypothetical protein
LIALAWVMVGSKPFALFITYQMPRIESGEAFSWIEDPQMASVNQSLYGLITELRLLAIQAIAIALNLGVLLRRPAPLATGVTPA